VCETTRRTGVITAGETKRTILGRQPPAYSQSPCETASAQATYYSCVGIDERVSVGSISHRMGTIRCYRRFVSDRELFMGPRSL
jgi:hypothetical protein